MLHPKNAKIYWRFATKYLHNWSFNDKLMFMIDTKQIRDAINIHGLKVKFLAEKIGVTPGTLSSFLTGKRGLGGAAKKALLRELGLPVESFPERTTSKTAS